MVTPKILQNADQYIAIPRQRSDLPLGVENTVLLEHLDDDGDGRVDGVGDNEDVCLGRDACDCGCKVADNGRVSLQDREHTKGDDEVIYTHVEEVITGHLKPLSIMSYHKFTNVLTPG